MFKKVLSGLALASVVSTAAFATPIILPGGVSVPDPLVAGNANFDPNAALGNVNNPFQFIQWFEDVNGNAVNLADVAAGNAGGLTFEDLILTGVGEITVNGGGAGDFACASCELTFEFGGLGIDFVTIPNPALAGLTPQQAQDAINLGLFTATIDVPALNPATSFINIFLDDAAGGFALDSLISGGGLDLAVLAEATDGTEYVNGIFQQANFNAETSAQNLALAGLADGELDASIVIDELGLGIANENFNTNALSNVDGGFAGLFDAFIFSASADFFGSGDVINTFSSSNSADLSANVVSAPATLGLFGLSLLTIAGLRRRS